MSVAARISPEVATFDFRNKSSKQNHQYVHDTTTTARQVRANVEEADMSDIFAGLGTPDPASTAIDPKRLFRALPKPSGSRFVFPHDIQSEVWDKWFLRRDEPDLIVKMNTGSGKTVIGLLILKSSLNEGKGPAAYLVPDGQLQTQVEEAADELGIAWTDDPRDAGFRQGDSILIAPVHSVYNGLSKFGLRGSTGPISVGSLVVDDAHACIPIIADQFSLKLPRGNRAYEELFALFADPLKEQSLAGYTGLRDGEGSHAVPLPYWAWQHQLELAFDILNKVKNSDDHKFVWPLIQGHIALCDVAFTPSEVEIRLPYPDLTMVPSFVKASRRIYMTATLADDSVLVSEMGVGEKCVVEPIAPASASDLGDRIILTPMETSRLVSHDDVKVSAARWAETMNVVVIVPSGHRAKIWSDLTVEVHDKKTIKDCISRLKAGHVGLVVLIARYDGVDLPGDACRVLILDGLPQRYSPQELVEAVAIGGTDAMNVRQTQRIEQGMGRGVRSTDDYCAVILLDSRLVERLYNAADRLQLSPATRAQYDLSRQFSSAGRNQPMGFFDEAVEAFLARSPRWTNASRQALEDVKYTSPDSVPTEATAQRAAFNEATAGRHAEASQALSPAISSSAEPLERGWIKQRAAAYLNLIDPAKARELQKSARTDNNYILKIGREVASVKLSALDDQAAATSGYLAAQFSSGQLLEVAIESLLLDLTPSTDTNSHKRFEAAFERLGKIIGLASSRPDQETGIGPDNFWALGGGRYWVIECKSESTAAQVSREYLEQLSHSADWFDSQYADTGFTELPLLIHPSRLPSWDAVPRKGARVMTFDKLADLRRAISDFSAAIRLNNGYRDAAVVSPNLRHFGLSSTDLEQRWTTNFYEPAPRRGRP